MTRLSYSMATIGGKEKWTQEKDGRKVNPAVIPTSHRGPCEAFELRNRGKAQGK